MIWRKWQWQAGERFGSASPARAEIEACREWTPALTALFDGEASADEALRARRHLLVCGRCAGAWLDWNQTRHLLLNNPAPPPPNLLWRVRRACRLGQAPGATPDLGAQILSRTSRRAAKPALGLAFTQRSGATLASALALGAFVVFLGRDSGLSAPPLTPPAANNSSDFARLDARPPRRAKASESADFPILPSRVPAEVAAPVEAPRAQVALSRAPQADSSLATLARARRERENLPAPISLISLDTDAPLPMLAPPKRRAPGIARHAASTVRVARIPRPIAPLGRLASPPVVLASVSVAPSVSEPAASFLVRAGRGGRILLASAPPSRTALRISAPRALPITMAQPGAPDDSGLDELDSTVQEYRATLSDDSEPVSDAG